MVPGTAGGPCHRLWLAGASPGLPRGTWGTVQTRQRAGLARPRARPSPAPRSAWRLPAGVDADSRALCAVSARGRARRTRGQSGHPAREWSAHWASPGAGGGGRGGCRPVSLQGRGESSWRGGPVVARRPGAGGSEGANVRSPWEVTQPLLRVRQPLSGSCRRQALVPRQRLVLTPDPVLALPGPSRRPWGGCPQAELDARTGAPGLRGSGRAERGGLLAGEGAACPWQRLPGEATVRSQPPARGRMGTRAPPITRHRGARGSRAEGSGDPPKEGWTPEPACPPPSPDAPAAHTRALRASAAAHAGRADFAGARGEAVEQPLPPPPLASLPGSWG